MAFSSTPQTRVPLGGSLKLYIGTWSGAVGDSAGTITLQGAKLFGGAVITQDANGYWTYTPFKGVDSTTGTITITVYNNADVTEGRYFFLVM